MLLYIISPRDNMKKKDKFAEIATENTQSLIRKDLLLEW